MKVREYIRNSAMIAVLTEIGGEYGHEKTIRETIEMIRKKIDFKELE